MLRSGLSRPSGLDGKGRSFWDADKRNKNLSRIALTNLEKALYKKHGLQALHYRC
jgi:hypothetical protein